MTGSLPQRALDIIHTSMLNKYFGENDRYPKDYEGIIISPLGVDAYEAQLIITSDETYTLRFSGRKLLATDVKLPNRDLNDKNIR